MPRRSPRARRLQDLKRVLGVPPREKLKEASLVEENQQEEPREDRVWSPGQESDARGPTASQGELTRVAAAEEG